jgi:hypothetical protein
MCSFNLRVLKSVLDQAAQGALVPVPIEVQ